jgi:hypothetical protein
MNRRSARLGMALVFHRCCIRNRQDIACKLNCHQRYNIQRRKLLLESQFGQCKPYLAGKVCTQQSQRETTCHRDTGYPQCGGLMLSNRAVQKCLQVNLCTRSSLSTSQAYTELCDDHQRP